MATCIQFDTDGHAVAVPGDPAACAAVILSGTEYAQVFNLIAAQNQPLDYVQAGAVFTFFFSFTVGIWYVAKNIGLILEAVRRF